MACSPRSVTTHFHHHFLPKGYTDAKANTFLPTI